MDPGKHLVTGSYEIIDLIKILVVGSSEIIDPILCETVGSSRIIDLSLGSMHMSAFHILDFFDQMVVSVSRYPMYTVVHPGGSKGSADPPEASGMTRFCLDSERLVLVAAIFFFFYFWHFSVRAHRG